MVRDNNKEEGEGSNANRPACAACRHQRRKCKEDCVLAPYFPMEKIQQYLAVHKVFGFSNMTKMLSNLGEQERKEAVESLEWEAMMWQQDPVLGPLGAYKKVCDMNRFLLTQQQSVQSFDYPKLMMGSMTHDLLGFNNGGSNEALAVAVSNNGVPPMTNNWALNNIGQNSNTSIFGNEVDSKVLNFVAAPNALLQRSYSSLLQPNYMPSLTSVAMPGVTPMSSPDMDQPIQNRGFQYYNMVNEQMGMLREGQGSEGNVENIYSYNARGQRRGISQRGRTGQTQEDNDHKVAHNRIRSQITDVQHLLYHLGHGKMKQDQQHEVNWITGNHQSEGQSKPQASMNTYRERVKSGEKQIEDGRLNTT